MLCRAMARVSLFRTASPEQKSVDTLLTGTLRMWPCTVDRSEFHRLFPPPAISTTNDDRYATRVLDSLYTSFAPQIIPRRALKETREPHRSVYPRPQKCACCGGQVSLCVLASFSLSVQRLNARVWQPPPDSLRCTDKHPINHYKHNAHRRQACSKPSIFQWRGKEHTGEKISHAVRHGPFQTRPICVPNVVIKCLRVAGEKSIKGYYETFKGEREVRF